MPERPIEVNDQRGLPHHRRTAAVLARIAVGSGLAVVATALGATLVVVACAASGPVVVAALLPGDRAAGSASRAERPTRRPAGG